MREYITHQFYTANGNRLTILATDINSDTDNNEMCIRISYCNKKDQFKKKIGTRIAKNNPSWREYATLTSKKEFIQWCEKKYYKRKTMLYSEYDIKKLISIKEHKPSKMSGKNLLALDVIYKP